MHDLVQSHEDVALDVRTRLGEVGLGAGPGARPGVPKETVVIGAPPATSKKLFEEIAEAGAAKMHVVVRHPVRSRPTAAPCAGRRREAARLPVGAEVIVFTALLGIAQDLVGLVDLLEFLLGGFLVLGDVRMVAAGQLAKRFLDIVVAGVPSHS